MRVLLVGHGRMGALVESLAPSYGAEVAGVVTSADAERRLEAGEFDGVDVAIDFTQAGAVPNNLPRLAARGISVVIGTTGWRDHEPALRDAAARADIGVLAAANFALGMALFTMIVEDAARRFSGHPSFAAWIHEWHHAAKKDAPSGTALQLDAALRRAGYEGVSVSSTRGGFVPGTHEVSFDAVAETITLTHTVRDRTVFARGALEAAAWLVGRRGWFTIEDLVRDRR